MKGMHHPTNDVTLNPSANETIRDVMDRIDPARRRFVRTAASASVLSAFGGISMSGLVRSVEAAPIPPAGGFGGIGFDSIPPSVAPVADLVKVPAGYKAELLVAWGDPVVNGGAAWIDTATQDAAAQEKQFGMHNDGMHFFPFPVRGAGGVSGVSSERGLLCVNHEYTAEEILHGTEGNSPMTIGKARKSQAGHGVSVVEVRNTGGKWGFVKNSAFGRRITGNTPMRIAGPAAGNDLMKSKKYSITPAGSVEDGLHDGTTCFGTLNNCAHGYTPWGTYLTCEENWNGYFAAPTTASTSNDLRRYGVAATTFGYNWPAVDPRFNADSNPLEPNHFGWVVEIDPFNPKSVPVKRTALGRFKHESAQVAVSADASGVQNRVAFYQGDDERNEYIYKFVCARPFNPTNRAANLNLLDDGTLYVARFTAVAGSRSGTFRGIWIPLLPDTDSVIDDPANPGTKLKLRQISHFVSPTGSDAEVRAKIAIRTRQAADAVGATMMDRPEWVALRTYWDAQYGQYGYSTYNADRPLELYCTLTNNNRRGGGNTLSGGVPAPSPSLSSNNPNGTTSAGSARPPIDVANPRPDNDYGHIIRWREDGNYVTALGFEWDIFVLCGDTKTVKTLTTNYQSTNFVPGSGIGPFYEGNINDTPDGSADLGAPDGLWFDQFGRMWVQTDQLGNATGDFVNIGANVMACADPNTKEVRRFLTSPPNCEVTGVINTPDGKTMFVGIQHPGEDAPPANPAQFSNWPRSQYGSNSAGEPLAGVHPVDPNDIQRSRPRSSLVVITREDGGIIGA